MSSSYYYCSYSAFLFQRFSGKTCKIFCRIICWFQPALWKRQWAYAYPTDSGEETVRARGWFGALGEWLEQGYMDFQLFTDRSYCCMWEMSIGQQTCTISITRNRNTVSSWTSTSSSFIDIFLFKKWIKTYQYSLPEKKFLYFLC